MYRKFIYGITGVILVLFIWYALGSDDMKAVDRYLKEKRIVIYPLPEGAVWMSPRERAIYGATHFWDHFDFSDSTLLVSGKKDMEALFVDYLNLLLYLPDSHVEDSLSKLLHAASVDSKLLVYFVSLAEKYFPIYDSSLFDKKLYLFMVEYALETGKLEKEDELHLKAQLRKV